jgi:ATP-dependent exoDNAse (exonuclease V) beta subunit
MTMHKAKGLEFDTVILPGLGKPPRGNELPVLAWQEVRTGPGRSAPILAPMAPSGADGDALHAYLTRLERRKETYEIDRLLYVACTRAKKRLHLIGQLQVDQDDSTGEILVRTPKSGSLLKHLWAAVATEARAEAAELPRPQDEVNRARVWVQPRIRRLPRDWRPPPPGESLSLQGDEPRPGEGQAPVYEWASSWAMSVGSVVHTWMEVIAEQGVDQFDDARIRGLLPAFEHMLTQLGTAPRDMDRATQRVVQALSAAVSDDTGRWILSSDHVEADSELPLTVYERGRYRQVVIDRTFVARDGCRWIIDYKTSIHEGGDLDAFLQLECDRHRDQLRRYRDVLSGMAAQPIRAALYFPLLTAFREVSLDLPV